MARNHLGICNLTLLSYDTRFQIYLIPIIVLYSMPGSNLYVGNCIVRKEF